MQLVGCIEHKQQIVVETCAGEGEVGRAGSGGDRTGQQVAWAAKRSIGI